MYDKVINNPSVSIIIPSRNEVHFIGACLDSVLQFEPPESAFEVLLVDGFSDDRTVAVVQQFASKAGRVRLLNNPERTMPYAMNIGLPAGPWQVRRSTRRRLAI